MQMALESAGLQNELTAEELSEMISITPCTSGRITTDDNYYINSSYTISLTMPYSFRWIISSDDFLKLICESYKTWFQQNYVTTAKALQESTADFESMDYSEIGSYFSMILTRMISYLDVREDNASSFISQDGSTFDTIRQHVTNLKNYDLETYNSYIWENGLSKDSERRIATLEYTNEQLSWDYLSATEKSQALCDIVDDYNNAMTSSVLIPTYDSQNEFYMSRTKTGIDDLTKEADSQLSTAVSTQEEIATNEDKLEKLRQGGTSDEYAQADQLIAQMETSIESIISQILAIDAEYVREKTGDYITMQYSTTSLQSRIHLKKVLVMDLLSWVVLYLTLAVYHKRHARRVLAWIQASEKRGERKEENDG
jgi:hypothetical protein